MALAMNIEHDVFCSDVASRAIGPQLLFAIVEVTKLWYAHM